MIFKSAIFIVKKMSTKKLSKHDQIAESMPSSSTLRKKNNRWQIYNQTSGRWIFVSGRAGRKVFKEHVKDVIAQNQLRKPSKTENAKDIKLLVSSLELLVLRLEKLEKQVDLHEEKISYFSMFTTKIGEFFN